MILQNYWAWRAQTQTGYTTASKTGVTGITDMTGTAVTALYYSTSTTTDAKKAMSMNDMLSYSITDTTELSLVFGSGNTTPTVLDYALDTDESANLTATGTNAFEYASDKLQIVFAYTVTNNTASEITLTEIGVKKKIYGTSKETPSNVLLAREILSTPISVGADETKSINYVWTMQ